MCETDSDDLKQKVENAVIESDEIDESEVTVGEPMSVSEFAEMMKQIQEIKNKNKND